MAVVLSHVHFCVVCNEFWTCFQLFCAYDDCDDLLCKLCVQGKGQAEVAGRGRVITEHVENNVAELPSAEQHLFTSRVGERAVPVLLEEYGIALKEL